MAKVFVSYSRKDTEFTKHLTQELQKSEIEFWVDWEGIPPTVDFMKKIENGIEESDAFLFLLSPDSAKSKVCGDEIAHAVKNNKRLIPLMIRDVKEDEVPAAFSHLNWIFFREQDDFDASFKKLLQGINTDFEWVEAHKRLLIRALEWKNKNKDKSFLLRGQDLQEAESQLALNSSKDPYPTDLHREYILKSRQATDQQRRWTTVFIAIAAVIMFALAVYGLNSARLAVNEAARANESEQREATAKNLAQLKETEAKINQLSALAMSKIDQSYNEALLLSVEAYLHAKDNKINDVNTQSAITKILQSHPGLHQILLGHEDWVNTMVLNPDQTILVSGSWDYTVNIWNMSNPDFPVKLSTLKEFTGPVENVTFTPDGKILATSSDYELILWDISDPSSPTLLSKTDGYFTNLGFTVDGKILTSLNIHADVNNTIALFDVSNPKLPVELIQLESGDESLDINSAIFNRNKNILFFTRSDGSIVAWDLQDPNAPTVLSTTDGFGSKVTAIALSPDENTLALGDTNTLIVLWDVTDPAAPTIYSNWSGHSLSINSLAFTADGNTLASSSNETNSQIVLWDVTDRYVPYKIRTINGHSLGVNTVLFNANNNLLFSGSRDGSIMVWDSAQPKTEMEIGAIDGTMIDMAIQPNSNILVSVDSDHKLTSWDISKLSSPVKIKTQDGPASIILFNKDGSLMASMNFDETVTLWDMKDFSKLNTIKLSGETINAIEFAPDGKTLAINTEKASFWDVSDPKKPVKISTLSQESNEISDMTINADGNLLAGIAANNVILWDISDVTNTKRMGVLEGHSNQVLAAAFSPINDSLLVTAGKDKTIILWNVDDPTNPQKMDTLANHSDWISSVAFSPDGTQLASGSYDKYVNLWNISNPEVSVLISKMVGHGGNIGTIDFDPSGVFLASLGNNDNIIFWDITPASWVQKACTITGGDLTDIQWKQYFPTEDYSSTCEPFQTIPEETTLIPSTGGGDTPEFLAACTDSQTPSCSEPTYEITDLFCIDRGSYGLYTLSPGTTFEVLTPGFNCINEDTNSDGEPRISCTGPADTNFLVSFCNSACTNSLETSYQCQAGFGLNAAEGCCAPVTSASNGCITQTLALPECE